MPLWKKIQPSCGDSTVFISVNSLLSVFMSVFVCMHCCPIALCMCHSWPQPEQHPYRHPETLVRVITGPALYRLALPVLFPVWMVSAWMAESAAACPVTRAYRCAPSHSSTFFILTAAAQHQNCGGKSTVKTRSGQTPLFSRTINPTVLMYWNTPTQLSRNDPHCLLLGIMNLCCCTMASLFMVADSILARPVLW